MVVVINFAQGEPYEKFRNFCSKTAMWFGKADKVIEYRYDDIPKSYRNKHKDIFAYKRGVALWLWKPFFIYETLQKLNEGDWLFYVDSGCFVIDDIHLLIKCAEQNDTDVMLFEMPLLNRQFTKRECYEYFGITDYSFNQCAATYLLVKKTSKSCAFIEEWLHCCEKEELLSPMKMHPEIEEFSDFVSHREDQSVLSLLRFKYNMLVFRDCSDYGETPHMYYSSHYCYNPKKYENSTFPTIVLSNRRVSPLKYYVRYKIKRGLRKLGFISPESIIKKKKRNNL